MKKPPFSGLLARTLVDSMEVRPEAAYLYDAVMLYVEAVNNLSKKQYDYRNGDLIISQLIGRTYNSAMGFKVYMDMNGDAEGKTKNITLKFKRGFDFTSSGNYTLLYKNFSNGITGLVPIGRFYLNQTGPVSGIPFLKLKSEIPWPGEGGPPVDQPPCGFHNERCPSSNFCDLMLGVIGGLLGVFLVVGGVAYRNWRYEQELDSLLWKIDFKELQLEDAFSSVDATDHQDPNIYRGRNSQISLSSNNENELRSVLQ